MLQFVDALVLIRTLKREAQRRVSLLVAQKSVHGFIGWASRQVGALPVGRAQDSAKPASGKIYLPDPIGDPTLVRGIGTKFDKEAEVSGMIFLPSVKGQTGTSIDIAEILGPEELRLKRPPKGKTPLFQLTGRPDIDDDGHFADASLRACKEGYEGTKYKIAAHIDQTGVYEAVFSRLKKNDGAVGIFPEGGSHDRTELLPLKAGVAIMALGTLAEAPDCGLKIVPAGLNYFHAHKFRSRAVIEFGPALTIKPELVEMYKNGQRRDAVARVLDMVHIALAEVTVSVPDYDTMMMIHATRRLIAGKGSLARMVEINRRLARGYAQHKDDERVKRLAAAVKDYNSQLHSLGLHDRQVRYAKLRWWEVMWKFVVRLSKLLFLVVLTLPGLLLFSPIFIVSKVKSRQKAAEALAGSSVKIQGRDVMATWKLLVAIALAPTMYAFYSVLAIFIIRSEYCPAFIPGWARTAPAWAVWPATWVVFITMTIGALKTGESGMDIVKSLRPLLLWLSPASSYSLQRLRERRGELQRQVLEIIRAFEPDLYERYEQERMDLDLPESGTASPASPSSPTAARRRADSEQSSAAGEAMMMPMLERQNTTQSSQAIPRNESFGNIGKVAMFSTRPPSRSRSRSSSAGGGVGMGSFHLSGFTTLDAKGGFDEAHRRIQEALHQQSEVRRRKMQKKNKEFELAEDDESEEDDEE